jgi:hypothetical protein
MQDASAKAREDPRERIGWAAEGAKPGNLTIDYRSTASAVGSLKRRQDQNPKLQLNVLERFMIAEDIESSPGGTFPPFNKLPSLLCHLPTCHHRFPLH